MPATSCAMGVSVKSWSRGRRRVRTASPADKTFLQVLRDNPDLWERITSGRVTPSNVVCKTPTADLSLIERTTEASTLKVETIRALDAKINPPAHNERNHTMTPEFEAVTPERAVEIMRAWAYHSWPMTVQDGIEVCTGLGFTGDPQDPESFASDMRDQLLGNGALPLSSSASGAQPVRAPAAGPHRLPRRCPQPVRAICRAVQGRCPEERPGAR